MNGGITEVVLVKALPKLKEQALTYPQSGGSYIGLKRRGPEIVACQRQLTVHMHSLVASALSSRCAEIV